MIIYLGGTEQNTAESGYTRGAAASGSPWSMLYSFFYQNPKPVFRAHQEIVKAATAGAKNEDIPRT